MATKNTTKLTKTQQMAAAAKAKATPAVAKTPAVKAEQPTFEVTITVESPMSSSIKGVVYAAQTITIFSQAKDEVTAKNKAVRSFGIGQRTDVKYTVSAKPGKAPRVAAYAPSK